MPHTHGRRVSRRCRTGFGGDTSRVGMHAFDEEAFVPADRAALRAWLRRNHGASSGIWVMYPKLHSGVPGPTYDDIVEEALCFGWIDSVVHRTDDPALTSIRITPRRPGSIWARSNRERVKRLTELGRMSPAGLAAVERAKADGSWRLLADVEDHVIRKDLAKAFDATPGSREAFAAFPASTQEQLLYWCYSAKQEKTRTRRIQEVVRAATVGALPGKGKR